MLQGSDCVSENLAPQAAGDRVGVRVLCMSVDDAAGLSAASRNEYPLSIRAALRNPLFHHVGAIRSDEIVASESEVRELICAAIGGRENRLLISRDVDNHPQPRPNCKLTQERAAIRAQHFAEIESYSGC